LPLLARTILIVSALTTSAARLHAHAIDSVYATQELNRCLRVVAASRKQTSRRSAGRDATKTETPATLRRHAARIAASTAR
jgi:hypothetical protein